jgi:hypothetical protein
MTFEELSLKIEGTIRNVREGEFSFDNMEEFRRRLAYLRDSSNHLNVDDLLGKDKGHANAKKILSTTFDLNGKHFLETKKKYEHGDDVKGLYVWFNNGDPFYVGIGGKIVNRLAQHVKYPNHNAASMAFKIARLVYGVEFNDEGVEFTRGEYNQVNIANVQQWLLQQQVAICRVEDNDDLAAFEIYCAIELDTVLNTFETH